MKEISQEKWCFQTYFPKNIRQIVFVDSNILPDREMIQPKKIHGIGFGNIFAGENKIELRKPGAAVGEGKKIDIVNKEAATINNKVWIFRKNSLKF